MWEHEFICLADTNQTVPPNPMEKAELINAGLGPKRLSIFEYGEAFEFHDDLLHAFPKLANAGGYELLRTLPNNNQKLYVIPPKSGGYTVSYLKSIVANAKVFIRPLQQKLSLEPLLDDNDVVSLHTNPLLTSIATCACNILIIQGIAPTEVCLKCLKTFPIFQLKDHLITCTDG